MENRIGIDEVGRGCWAGPLLVVAARATAELPPGMADSKQLSRRQRQQLLPSIVRSCELGEGWVTAQEIDQQGLANAMRLGVDRALTALRAQPTEPIIMDGPVNYCGSRFSQVQCIIKADASHPIVSAASIYAKELRDAYMAKLAERYPGYGLAHNVGYGTKAHVMGLQRLGTCSIHRQSYKPIKAILMAERN